MIWRDRKDDAGSNGGETESVPAPSAGDPGSDVESILTSRVESILEAAEEAAAGIRQEAEERAGHYLEEARMRTDVVAAERIRQISELTDTLVNRVRAVAQQSDELIAALDDAGRRVTGNAQPDPSLESPETQSMGQVSPSPAPEGPPYDPMAPPSPYLGAEPPPPAPPQPAPPSPAPPVAAPPPVQAPPQPHAPPQPPAAQPPAYSPPPPPSPAPPPRPPVAPPPAPEPYEPPAPEPPPVEPPHAAPRVSDGARLLATQMAVAGSNRDEIAWRLHEEFGIQDSSAILDEIGI